MKVDAKKKEWAAPQIEELNISKTLGGFRQNRYEGGLFGFVDGFGTIPGSRF